MTMTEEQQIEVIKAFWKRYGSRILTVATLVLIVYVSWTLWTQRQMRLAIQASKTYDQLLLAYDQNDDVARATHANYLKTHYSKTPYAMAAGLFLANTAVANKDYPQALQQLKWVMQHANEPALKQVARNRAARVLLAEQQYEKALAMLQQIDDKAYQPVVSAIIGDIYMALKQFEKARDYYKLALKTLPPKGSLPLVQIKLDDLAEESMLKSPAKTAIKQ